MPHRAAPGTFTSSALSHNVNLIKETNLNVNLTKETNLSVLDVASLSMGAYLLSSQS